MHTMYFKFYLSQGLAVVNCYTWKEPRKLLKIVLELFVYVYALKFQPNIRYTCICINTKLIQNMQV